MSEHDDKSARPKTTPLSTVVLEIAIGAVLVYFFYGTISGPVAALLKPIVQSLLPTGW